MRSPCFGRWYLYIFTHILPWVGTPTAFILALRSFISRLTRDKLLSRAVSAALEHGDKNPRGRAGLEVIRSLTGENEPWYRAILPWRRSDEP